MEKQNGVMPWNERSEALTRATVWVHLEHTLLSEKDALSWSARAAIAKQKAGGSAAGTHFLQLWSPDV